MLKTEQEEEAMPTLMVLLDTEFTSLLGPELLSLGMATTDDPPETFYAEIDLTSEAGKRLVGQSSEFVRDAVLTQWGRVEGASGTPWDLGRRAGEWLLALHERISRGPGPGGPAEGQILILVGFDYWDDYALLEEAIRDAGLWDRVREVVRPAYVDAITGTIDGKLAAERCYEALRERRLHRHHALADALALRAAYTSVATRLTTAFADQQGGSPRSNRSPAPDASPLEEETDDDHP